LFSCFLSSHFVHIGGLLGRGLPAIQRGCKPGSGARISASPTLLALIIGFSFSMAVSRHDQRKRTMKKKQTPLAPNTLGLICCPLAYAAKVASYSRDI
jgi:hypothetical protein